MQKQFETGPGLAVCRECQHEQYLSHEYKSWRCVRCTKINAREEQATGKPIVMRLFVWENFCPDYTNGLAFAAAETVEHAQELVTKATGYTPDDWGTLREFDLSSPVAFAVSGGG